MPPARKPARSLATPKEVADYLGDISVATLKDWRRKGTGPSYIHDVGRHVRYDWADVEDWVKVRRVERRQAADGKRPAA